ncbi:MAG: cyanophycinase [Saccharospirillum sp.]|nr:cyanophycinase [Saccharospirillum sp.]
MNKLKTSLKWGTAVLCAGFLAGCEQDNGNGSDPINEASIELSLRSQLVGGATSVCSSVVQSACNDWDTWWAANGDAEANVAVAVSEPVELSEQKISTLVNDPAWESDPDFKTGVELILNYLRDQILDEGVAEYPDWQDFRSAFIGVANEDVAGLPEDIDGDVIWFDSTSAQYGTFEGLKKADERLNYEVTSAKATTVTSLIDGLPEETLTEEQQVISDVIADLVSPDSLTPDELLDAMAAVALEGETLADGTALWNDELSNADWDLLVDTVEDNSYVVDAAVIADLDAATWESDENKAGVLLVLDALLEDNAEVDYGSFNDFRTAFRSTLLTDGFENGLQVWNSLPSLVRFKLLEILLIDLEDYERAIEYVAVDDTANADAVAIYQAFVDQARDAADDETPHILVMTSSSADSYAVADYYVGIFEQLGATAQWLPVDRAYRQARDSNQCDWLAAYHSDFAAVPHLDQLYPDYFQAHLQACEQGVADLIENAHGVFINGGDQVRTFDALVSFDSDLRIDSAELLHIQSRQQDGHLVVGGTSAGAAVQSGGLADNGNTNPMITAGSSHGILVNGFTANNHEATGGIETFPWGVVDTHFSERAREGRLIRLLAHADVRFGFGVDETTALNVAKVEAEDEATRVVMQVTGENGVYIVDMASAHILQEAPFEVRDVVTHFLNDGDRFILYPETGEYEIEFAEGGTALDVGSDATAEVTNDDILYEDNYRSMAAEMMTNGATEATGTSWESEPEYSVTLSLDDDTAAQTKDDKVSYRNLKVEFLQDGNN